MTEATEKLISVALDAMETLPMDYGDLDLLSAVYTIALRVTDAAVKKNENMRPMAVQAAQLLLIRLANSSRPQ